MSKYNKMSDFEINKAVASFDASISRVLIPFREDDNDSIQCLKSGAWCWFNPCNSWADAGPIIHSNLIDLESIYKFTDESEEKIAPTGEWSARGVVEGNIHPRWQDNNPLRAAMIVFLMMQEVTNEC